MPERECGRPVDEGDEYGWILTFTGRKFYPLDPKIEDIDIVDIAHALSNMPRFTGHTREFYSCAQHSCLVGRLSLPNSLKGLLHDASEAYLCDIATPVKHSGVFVEYRKAEAYLQNMILLKFGFRKFEMPRSVKDADRMMCIVEGRSLMPMVKGSLWADVENGDFFDAVKFEVWTPERAEKEFLSDFHYYTRENLLYPEIFY